MEKLLNDVWGLGGYIILAIAAVVVVVLKSFYAIGPTEIGLVRKRFGKKLPWR